jgi:hypothetical protein
MEEKQVRENETFSTIEKRSIKDYISENTAIINDLLITINHIDVFVQGDKNHKENIENPEPSCLFEEIRVQSNDLKIALEKAQEILEILR